MRWLVAGAAAVAFALRVSTPRGLWLDELTQRHQSALPFSDMMGILYREDNHPPLYYAIQWCSLRLVGDSELALRLPSVLLGTVLVPLLYVVGRDLYDRRVGATAAVLGAVAPLAVWYGGEARMYALFMLLSLTGVWAVARLIRGNSNWWWSVLVAANVGVVLTQWFAVLHVIALELVLLGVVWARRRTSEGRRLARGFALSLVAQAVLLAPALPFAVHQFAGNQERGLGFASASIATGSAVVPRPGVYTGITNLVWGLFGYQSDRISRGLGALWPVALLAVLLLMGRARRRANRYLAVVVIVPFGGMILASLLASNGRSLAEVRYFVGAVPALLLLVAAAATSVLRSRRAQVLGGVVLVGALLLGVVGQIVETNNPRRYGYREALAEVAARAEPGDQLLYAPFFLDVVLEYYSPAVPVTSLEDEPLPPDRAGTVYVLLSPGFADTGSESRTQAALDELRTDHRLVDVIREPNVEIQVYRGAVA